MSQKSAANNPLGNERLVLRAARMDDLDALMEMSSLVGSGMTSMPIDEASWIAKLERSTGDFAAEQAQKSGDIYFMVLEDLESGRIVGSGAVYAGIGLQQPFYSYKITTLAAASERLDLHVQTRVLSLVNDFTGSTEIGSLFLLPEYRRDGIGKFLSRSRFLLLADFPERFDEQVFAEMRGWLNEHDESPFWNALGRKFFDLKFQEADYISATDGFQFISDLMPKYPVYLDLLPQSAQEVVGRPHEAAAGAFRILQQEGFRYENYVDIFDAGPSVQVPLKEIRTVADSEVVEIAEIRELDAAGEAVHSCLCSNSSLPDYRITRGLVDSSDEAHVIVSPGVAETLKIHVGASIRIVPERVSKASTDNGSATR